MFASKLWIFIGLSIWLPAYAAGEYLSRLWASPAGRWWMIPALFAAYDLGVCGWLPALASHGKLAVLTVIFSLLALIVGTFVGVTCFGETLTSVQWCGIALAVLACLMLQ